MRALWSGKLSAAKSGWLIALLFFGFLAFLFVPGPKKPEPQPPPPSLVKPPPSGLVALGLPDNPDLEHLPEFFAVWADQAEWKDDKTIFAYWNPGSNSYSYFFEATRINGKFAFRPISKFDAYKSMSDEESLEYELGDYVPSTVAIAAINPITDSPTHPIVWFHAFSAPWVSTYRPGFGRSSIQSLPKKVEIDLKANSQPLPKMEIKILRIPHEPTKK